MRARFVLTLPMIAVLLCCCGSEDPVQGTAFQPLRPRKEFLSNDGRRFVLATTARRAVHEKGDASGFNKSIEEMDLDELAEALRPVTLVDGQEYILESPDHEAAALAKAGEKLGGASYSPDGEAEVPRPSQTNSFCCGADGRSVVRSNTIWPYRTVIAMAIPDSNEPSWGAVHGECTMQLIGAATATSVAHCFHDSTNWLPLAVWGAGPDAQDGLIFPPTYPAGYGCYSVYVPVAWEESGGSFQYDYAVVDFRGGCRPAPGGVVGWLGWGVYSDDEIKGTGAFGYGVPALAPYPQIHGMWTSSATIDVGTYSVDHSADCSDGDSGRGLWQYIDSDWRSTANHSLAPVNGKCRDRRLTSEVSAFIVANSEF